MNSISNSQFFKQIFKNYSLNTLGSIWYCILATCLQIYIITRSIYRFTAYIALPWPNSVAPESSINFYMLFIGCSILILPFFIVVALMKIGNYSNDGRKLGLFSIQRYSECLNKEEENNLGTSKWLQTFWKHSLPIAPMLHLLIAFCFIFPRLVIEAQLIRHGFLSKADIWKTDLDFVLAKFNGKIFNFFGLLRTINATEHRYIFSESVTLGQYFIRNSKSLSDTFYELDESGKFSIEFFNFIIALFIFTIRYPAVFWHVNKPFSLIFSFQLVFNTLQSIIALSAFQVTFKVFVCDPTHLLLRFRESSSLSLSQLSILFLVYLLVLHTSSISLYIYGSQKYREYRYARTKYLQDKYESKSFANFLPYLVAMLFFLLLSLLIGPLFYEFVIIYCGSLNISALLVILSTIIYFTFWIMLWVFLAIKTVWTFNYDDFESSDLLLGKEALYDQSLLVIYKGKSYRVREDAAKQAIFNFVQDTLSSNQHNDASLFELNRMKPSRMSTKSFKSETNCKSFQKNNHFRYSTRSCRNKLNPNEKTVFFLNDSDSEGEYTTFQKLRRTHSFNQKSCLKNKPVINRNVEYGPIICQNKSNLTSQIVNQTSPQMTYGLNFMCNPLLDAAEPSSPSALTDKASDTSSGIHSGSSNCSVNYVTEDKQQLVKSNSLESLMQRLEAAAADKPNLRSLTSFQNSVNLLNEFDTQIDSKSSHVKLSTFSTENNIYGTKASVLKDANSKLAMFTENPDYSKYYSLVAPAN